MTTYEPSRGWRLVTDDDESKFRLCRAGASRWTTACGMPSAAAVMRTHGDRYQEWHYCLDHVHAYGNKIIDGAVVRPSILDEDPS